MRAHTEMQALQEDETVRRLALNRVYPVEITSLNLSEKMYLFERRKINIPAVGESEYEHLLFLTRPTSEKDRTFYYSIDARRVSLNRGKVVEKVPFEDLEFGKTFSMQDVTARRKLISEARKSFGGCN